MSVKLAPLAYNLCSNPRAVTLPATMQQNARKQSEKANEIAAAAALANGCSVDDLKNSMQTNGNNSDDNNNNNISDNNSNSKWHCFVPESCTGNSSIDGLKITH